MAIYWTSANIPGYSPWSNPSWSSFMNAYARHPYDTNANANNLPDVYGSATITAPYSGTYTLCGAADNYGAIDLGGQNTTINGFSHSGICVSRYFSRGQTIPIAWNFGNVPSSESFAGNPSAIALRLTGPDAPPFPSASLSISPTAIIQGGSVTLTWSSSNGTSFSLTDVGGPGSSGSRTLTNITTSRTYTYTVCNESGCASSSRTLTVYVPPTINVTADNPTIIVGGSTTIRWSHTGDASSVSWTSGGLTNTNLNSSSVVSPTTTTSYCAVATGLGGTSPENCATVIVYAPPIIEEFVVPASINYGTTSFNVEYETKYANTELKIEFFNAGYNSGPNSGSSFLEETRNLTTAASAENGSSAASANGIITYSPVWDNFGPRSIVVRLTCSGNGGSVVQEKTVLVNIDETPDNIAIEESEDLLKDADPVITPETDVLSEMYLVNDIDIPVEVKSDWPILIDVNKNDSWTKIRQIGGGVGGNSVLSNSVPEELFELRSMNVPAEDPPTFDVETDAVSFSFSNGANSVAFMQGGSATFSWYLSGGYTSASITNHGSLPQTSGATTYFTRTIFRWFGPNPPPGDHMCALSNPGGYTSVIALCQFFTSPPPGSFGGYDAEAPGVKPTSGLMGYVWPTSYLPPGASTQLVYEFIDPNGGTPSGFGTIWTLSPSGEGPYTIFIQSFRVPTAPWTDYSTVTFSGSATKSPTTTTSYTLTATGPYVGTYTKTITATVYVPPTISLTSSLGTAITAGQSTIIYWTVAGDANTISWTSGDITNTNLNSNSTVSPNDTTTYCAVASGLGGTSPETCITITVYQIPTGSLTIPAVVNYNENFNIEYDTKYANTSITITPTYQYLDGTSVTGTTINRIAATGSELSDPDSDTVRTGIVPITVPWNDFGPYEITFALTATGSGGSANVPPSTVLVNVDQTPDNITIEESDGFLKDADPVITPETDILSEMYLINDIDIPVEVKSDWPIKVDVNGGKDWEDVREIGSGLPPAGGNSLPSDDDIDIPVEWIRLPDHD